ncbi:unnamed protein product [Ectocarpus sp. 4 AP-2014]
MEYTAVGDIPGIVGTLREAYQSGTTRSLEWRRKQLNALRRMCEENEDAMADALKKDLRRCYNTAVTYELWDIIAQVGRFGTSSAARSVIHSLVCHCCCCCSCSCCLLTNNRSDRSVQYLLLSVLFEHLTRSIPVVIDDVR